MSEHQNDNNVEGGSGPFQPPQSVPSQPTSTDTQPSLLSNMMKEAKSALRDHLKAKLYYEEEQWDSYCGQLETKCLTKLRSVYEGAEYETASENFLNWFQFVCGCYKGKNCERRNLAAKISTSFDYKFGDSVMANSFEYEWLEACVTAGDIEEKFMSDDPFDLDLLRNLTEQWTTHYRQQKRIRANILLTCVVFIRRYETTINNFLVSDDCDERGKLHQKIAETRSNLENPFYISEAMTCKLETIIGDLNRQFFDKLKEKIENQSILQISALYEKLDHQAREKLYKQCPQLLTSADNSGNIETGSSLQASSRVPWQSVREPAPEKAPTSSYGISIHFGVSETLVRCTMEDADGKLDCKDLGPYPSIMGISKNRRGSTLLEWEPQNGNKGFCPSALINDHRMVATLNLPLLQRALQFEEDQPNEDANCFYSEELLALVFLKIMQDIRKKHGLNPLRFNATAAVSIPAMAHPACRQRLKTSLDLVGWENSIIVHSSTAIALACAKPEPPGSIERGEYQAVAMFIRRNLVEVAVFAVSGENVKIISVKTIVPKKGSAEVSSLDAVTMTMKLLGTARSDCTKIRACYMVAEMAAELAGAIASSLTLKQRWNVYSWSPLHGVIEGLDRLSTSAFPRKLYDEVFPWLIKVDHGAGRKHRLVHANDKAVEKTSEVLKMNLVKARIDVYAEADFYRAEDYLFISVTKGKIRARWPNEEKFKVKVSCEGLNTLIPATKNDEDEENDETAEGIVSKYNMATDSRTLKLSKKKIHNFFNAAAAAVINNRLPQEV